jgi:zinc-finger of transposase IS204/IS1001/IS1096/IS1165
MKQRSDGATVLLGMPEFVVGAQLEVGGELWLMVETTAEVVGCEGCGTRAVGHGRRRVRVRDLPMADRPVVLVWAKRLWRCPDPACPVATWSEEVDDIAPRAALTERARAEICRLASWRGWAFGRAGGTRLRGRLAHRHGGGARSRAPAGGSSVPARCPQGPGRR